MATRLTCSGRLCPGMALLPGTNGPLLTSLPLTVAAAQGHLPATSAHGAPDASRENEMTVNQQKLNALVERLFAELSAGYGGVMVSIGDKLALYQAMAGARPLSSQEVARRTGRARRRGRARLDSPRR